MSNAVSALNGKVAAGDVTVAEMGLQGMISLRGSFDAEDFVATITHLVGVDFPDVRQIVSNGERSVAWMSPDELLILCPYDQAVSLTAQIAEALAEQHFLVANVSDARALFSVAGPFAAEVLAKVAPVDFSASAFAVGEVRRTRLAQVAGAVWKEQDGSLRVVCFRSVAHYTFDLLATSAKAGPVGVL